MTPLIALTLAFVTGIWLAKASIFPLIWLLLALPLTLILHIGWREHLVIRWLPWITAGLLLGAGRLWLARPRIDNTHIAFYNTVKQVEIVGLVAADPDRRPQLTNLRVRVESLMLPDGTSHAVHGLLLVKAPTYTPVQYGDLINIQGDLESPPVYNDFSYKDYLARENIHSFLKDGDIVVMASHQACPIKEQFFRFKAYALHTSRSLLSEPQAALMTGILLGNESGLPKDLEEAFQTTGTSHIIAISGFNLSIIAAQLATLVRRVAKKRGELLLALTGIWGYTLLVGASAAVTRAAIMVTIATIATHQGRKLHGPTSLAAAAWIMLLYNPYTLWDVGFQLSITATAGLIFYAEPLTQWTKRHLIQHIPEVWAEQILSVFSDTLLVTIAAQITTLGVMMGTFQSFSLVTLFTNLLILPVQSFIMLSGGIALLTGLIIQPLGQFIAGFAWVFLTWTLTIVKWTATFPNVSLSLGNIAFPLIWGYYAILVILTVWFKQPKKQRAQMWRELLVQFKGKYLIGIAIIIMFFGYLYALPDGRLHIYFLDVGQGESILLETPQGKQILIDGGTKDTPRTLSKLGNVLSFWDHHLDMIISTSSNETQLAGLIAVLERYRVDFVITAPEEEKEENSLYTHWEKLLTTRETGTVGTLYSGQVWEIEPGITLQALWPEPALPGPLVLRINYNETGVLLPGEATTRVEESLVAREGDKLKSSVLLLARHGATTSSTPAFLQAVAPELVIISVDGTNYTSYPAPEVLARVLDKPHYRTDIHGTIEIISDGQRIQVHPERR
ncbi:MAG: ComEC/Rec2 family competence protein [Anaerolineae bacterium]|nr:ComEC/Rec2 family competence protein [Anaerolineae bacterium]